MGTYVMATLSCWQIFMGVSLDYLFCRTENRAEINTPLRELHLSDEMVAPAKMTRI